VGGVHLITAPDAGGFAAVAGELSDVRPERARLLNPSSKGRLKLLAGCLAAAVATHILWVGVINRDGSITLFLTRFPWIRAIRYWLSPAVIGMRVANLFGLRFDVQHYDDNWAVMLVSTAVEVLIWTFVFFCVASFARWLRTSRARPHAA